MFDQFNLAGPLFYELHLQLEGRLALQAIYVMHKYWKRLLEQLRILF